MTWQAPWEEEYRRIDALRQQIDANGESLGFLECQIGFYRLGDIVYCVRSYTQIDYCCKVYEWETYRAPFADRLREKPLPYPD